MGSVEEISVPIMSIQPQGAIETDLLIVGAGPAGASLACFLARYGLTGLMISSAPGTADTPRAHMNNRAAMDCLRDIGLWDECKKLGHGGEYIMHYRWCETLAGEEYGRNFSWGHGDRESDYKLASPCHHVDLPQSLLEPVLVRNATNNGFRVRFDTEFLSFEEDKESGRTICLVQDTATGLQYKISTKYLFGCDGGRSKIARQLDLPMTVVPGGGIAVNVLVSCDLTHLMASRQGNLHWCMRLEEDYPFNIVARMVKPWHEWMFVVFPKGPTVPPPSFTYSEWAKVVGDCIGDPSVTVKTLGVSKWVINETFADVVSKGNVFCLGDAIHRHPPTLGLGSNTCIQDAFNLSWKIALVLRGLASPALLDTYNTERQPIAASLVKASNDCLRKHIALWQALGAQPPGSTLEDRMKAIKGLKENSKEGRERRKLVKERQNDIYSETAALGIEMGQYYGNSPAVYAQDEKAPFEKVGKEKENPDLFYVPCTYPGRRLPHVWLNTPIPGPLVSTIDIAGKGRFCLFTGIGGEGWKDAASKVGEELGVEVKAVGIGRGLDWEDAYLHWEEQRGVEEDGCVLVRPDLFVAWRASESGNEIERLGKAMRAILGREL